MRNIVSHKLLKKKNRNTPMQREARGRRRRILAAIATMFSLALVTGGVLFALRAPEIAEDFNDGSNVQSFYYVSNNIKQNGDFPSTYIAFYWSETSGTKTITYNGKQCNQGGYGDSGSSNVYVTIYTVDPTDKTGGMKNTPIRSQTQVTKCHNNQSKGFTFDLSELDTDYNTGLKTAIVKVQMKNTGRAFFTLTSDNNAQFGALGNNTIGYSRDFKANQPGFYNITLNFGNICSTTETSGRILFADVDDGNKYQSHNMTFRVKPVGGSWLPNTDSSYAFSDSHNMDRSAGTLFHLTAGSGQKSWIDFTMKPGVQYEMQVRNISDMNDIAVFVPTNEIYGKASCVSTGGANTITPYVNLDKDVASPGEKVNFDYTGFNSGSSATSTWLVRDIVIAAGTNMPAEFSSTHIDWDCSDYTRAGITCSDDSSRTGSHNFLADQTAALNSEPYTLPNGIAVGTRICRVLSVDPYKDGTSQSQDSSVKCVQVGKYPALYVQNGGVRVGGATSTSGACVLQVDPTDSATNDPYGILMHDYQSSSRGSYAQFAGIALGTIENFGSNALYYNSSNALTKNLLFGSAGYGAYTANGLFYGTTLAAGSSTFCLPNTATLYNTSTIATTNVTSSDSPVINNLGSTSGTIGYNFTASDRTLTIQNTGTIGHGKRVVVYAKQAAGMSGNTILIKDDIAYNNSGYNSVSEFPQIVIVADGDIDIRIDGSVHELDGIYITGGNIYTCDGFDGTVPMSISDCTQPLTVNGALVAGGRVLPYRTFGYDTVDNTDPAEIFNLSPNSLVGDYDRARSEPSVTTDKLSELPTRL